MDGVQKYDRVDALQRPLLPFFCHGQDLVRDSADVIRLTVVSDTSTP